MMFSKTKYSLFALMVMALVMVRTTNKIHAFSTPALSQSTTTRLSTTSLYEQQQDSNDQERRGFFSSVKSLFGAAVLVAGVGSKPLPVFAEETDTSPSGNIIEIEVNNLDGGVAGTIKIQMKPEWAPRGVARFEVSEFIALPVCVFDGFIFVVMMRCDVISSQRSYTR